MSYANRLKALLSPAERRLFAKLSTPHKIQDYLDHFPVNFGESAGEPIIKSPRHALAAKKFHCMEGAMVAAAALACHGQPPLLMDMQSAPEDHDHVVALFKTGGYWGAISKTNYPTLRWRDPVYKTPRELAMSYYHEYFMWYAGSKHPRGKKTMRTYSAPFDLRRYRPEEWFAAADLDWLAEELDDSRHFAVVPEKARRYIRPASTLETRAMELTEWSKRGKRNA